MPLLLLLLLPVLLLLVLLLVCVLLAGLGGACACGSPAGRLGGVQPACDRGDGLTAGGAAQPHGTGEAAAGAGEAAGGPGGGGAWG
jgi:hypothetical protein